MLPIQMYDTYIPPVHVHARLRLMLLYQIGKVGELEEVDEYRVEIMCLGRDTAVKAVEALKK